MLMMGGMDRVGFSTSDADAVAVGVAPSPQPTRYVTPSAPLEEPVSVLLSDGGHAALREVNYPQATEAYPISTEVQAIPINPQEQDQRIIVLPYYQGGYTNHASAPPDDPADFVPPPATSPQHISTADRLNSSGTSELSSMEPEQSTRNNQQESANSEASEDDKTQMLASGIAGAVVGGLLLGPSLGVFAGFYSAYATKKCGATRDIAIALGEIALITRDKARMIDEKHHLVDQSKQAAREAWEYAKALDRRHRILEKAKDFVLFSWREVMDFSRHHRILERGVVVVGRGFEWVYIKLSRKTPAITYAQTE